MSAPGSRSSSPAKDGEEKPKKFMNGWTKEQENLMASWADIASCYRWMHDKCEKRYSGYNMSLSIPVIILSTLTGTANFAIDSFVPANDDSLKKYVQAGIGGISIFAGILTTLGNFLRFAQLSESNRVASISWGKLQRQIAVELRIHPNDRLDCLDFLKICRAELDRLIEQSPAIPDAVIREFEAEFKDSPNLIRPDIAHGMDHTQVFHDKDTFLKKLTVDAAILLKAKKKMLRDEIVPDLDRRINDAVEPRIAAAVTSRMKEMERQIQEKINSATENTVIQVLEDAKKEEDTHVHTRLRIRAPIAIPAAKKQSIAPALPSLVAEELPVPSIDPGSPRHDEIGSMTASAFRIVQPEVEGAAPSFEINFSTPVESPIVSGSGSAPAPAPAIAPVAAAEAASGGPSSEETGEQSS